MAAAAFMPLLGAALTAVFAAESDTITSCIYGVGVRVGDPTPCPLDLVGDSGWWTAHLLCVRMHLRIHRELLS